MMFKRASANASTLNAVRNIMKQLLSVLREADLISAPRYRVGYTSTRVVVAMSRLKTLLCCNIVLSLPVCAANAMQCAEGVVL